MIETLNNFIGTLPHSQQFLIPIIDIIFIIVLILIILKFLGVRL